MKTLDEQYQAILQAKRDLDKMIVRVPVSETEIIVEMREQGEALLDAAETIKRVKSLVNHAVELFKTRD